MSDTRLVLKISEDQVSANLFLNYLLLLLTSSEMFKKNEIIGYDTSSSDNVALAKLRSLFFDRIFENLVNTFTLANYLNIKPSKENTPEVKEMDRIVDELKSFADSLELDEFGIEIDKEFLTKAISYIIGVDDKLSEMVNGQKILDYENLEKIYNQVAPKFPLLSFIYAYIPEKTDREVITYLKNDILVKDIEELRKKYSNLKLYWYKDIDLVDYYITDEEFESDEMYELYEILERLGIYEDTIEDVFDLKLNSILNRQDAEGNTYMYVFKEIKKIDKKFDNKLYEYYKGMLFDQIFDETTDKMLDEASDSVNVSIFEETMKDLRKISQMIFDKYVKYINKPV
jgi:hypothetical protein